MNHLLKCHPIIAADFVRGAGAYLFDSCGRSFLDLESGSWAAVLGHSHPELVELIREEAGKVMHLGVRTPNHLAEEAAIAVLSLLGISNGKCTFLSSGSEAVEFGVQAAKCIRPRPFCLSFKNSYLSAFGCSGKKDPSEWIFVDPAESSLQSIDERLDEIPFEKVSCFVLEAGGGGPLFVRFPQAPLVTAIARRVRECGGLVVCNEVTTGFGRTGRWFGFQHYDLRPDIVALGKGLGNGYPVSAVVFRDPLAQELEANSFYHAQSHQNNPLGCAVALSVIRILQEGNWIERGAAIGERFLAELKKFEATKSTVKQARGRGPLLALELRTGQGETGSSLQQALWKEGFIVGGYPGTHSAGTGLRFDPPLILEPSDLERFLDALDGVLA